MCSFQSCKYSIQDQKSETRKAREDAPLDAQRLPENVSETKRTEPQQVDPVRERGAAPKNNCCNDREKYEECAAMGPRWICVEWKINRLRQFFTWPCWFPCAARRRSTATY